MKRKTMTLLVTILMIVPVSLTMVPDGTEALRYGSGTDVDTMDVRFHHPTANDNPRRLAKIVGDINGDGYDDLVMGKGYWSDHDNEVFLFFGRSEGFEKDVSLFEADASFEPGSDFSYLIRGKYVAGPGDINGDGYDDLVLADTNDHAYLVLGKASGWAMNSSLPDVADGSIIDDEGFANIEYSISGAGDVNGDGYMDVLLTDPWTNNPQAPGDDNGKVYLVPGGPEGWGDEVGVSTFNSSFLGIYDKSLLGFTVAAAGDVNGDGLDDFLVSSVESDTFTQVQGRVYLVAGQKEDYGKNQNISDVAMASFLGVTEDEFAGNMADGVGDVNGDGYDDFLITAEYDDETGNAAGKGYLIFGRQSGWTLGISLSAADVILIPEGAGDRLGWTLAGIGDVNMDGYDDFMIDAPLYDPAHGGDSYGKVYVFLGGTSDWDKRTPVANADMSFRNYSHSGILTGWAMGGQGDVNGDGADDIFFGSYGLAYLAYAELGALPEEVDSVELYRDEAMTDEVEYALPGDRIFVKLEATDITPGLSSVAVVNVTSNETYPMGVRVRLYETGDNTGVFEGSFTVSSFTHERNGWIGAEPGETIEVYSPTRPGTKDTLVVGAVELAPGDIGPVEEDRDVNIHFQADFASEPDWSFETNAPWASWDPVEHNLTGLPDNGDVGNYWVNLTVTDGWGRQDPNNLSLNVVNVAPDIVTDDIATAHEDLGYSVDYNSSDDGQGTVTWSLDTEASWLTMDPTTGVLNGTPGNGDVGEHLVNITVSDGNGGADSTEFTVSVEAVNDAPVITTENVISATQGQEYSVLYEATDEDDEQGNLTWYLETDAGDWLTMDPASGLLSGTPTNDDLGIHEVTVGVEDGNDGNTSTVFDLTVLNVNDAPRFSRIPDEMSINETEVLDIQMNATDVDPGDVVTYGIATEPYTGMGIDPATGTIQWTAEIPPWADGPPFVIEVTVTASDGEGSERATFDVVVEPREPVISLVSPSGGDTVDRVAVELEWNATDLLDRDLTFSVYIGTNRSGVEDREDTYLATTGLASEHYEVADLVPGQEYFWTVEADNGIARGLPVEGSANFTVSAEGGNHPPVIARPGTLTAWVGKTLSLQLAGADPDPGDEEDLVFSLVDGPEGMTLSESGLLEWKPSIDQKGTKEVVIVLSDGKSSVETGFDVKVKEAPGEEGIGGMGLMIPVLIVIIIVLAILAAVGFMRRGDGKGSTAAVTEPPTAPVPEERPTTSDIAQEEPSDPGPSEEGEGPQVEKGTGPDAGAETGPARETGPEAGAETGPARETGPEAGQEREI